MVSTEKQNSITSGLRALAGAADELARCADRDGVLRRDAPTGKKTLREGKAKVVLVLRSESGAAERRKRIPAEGAARLGKP